jgi:hypothetical protein
VNSESAIEAFFIWHKYGQAWFDSFSPWEGVRREPGGRDALCSRRAHPSPSHATYPFNNSVERLEHLVIRDALDFEAVLAHPRVARFVGLLRFVRAVCPAVHFDHKRGLGAIEIRDEWAEGMLASESAPFDLVAFQTRPEEALGEGHLVSECVRALDGERVALMVIVGMEEGEEFEIECVRCPSPPAHVGPPPRGRGSEGSKHLLRIRELRHPFRADEGGDFDLVDAGRGEEFDELDLLRSGDVGGLVLEAVAGGDVGDADVIGHEGMVVPGFIGAVTADPATAGEWANFLIQ